MRRILILAVLSGCAAYPPDSPFFKISDDALLAQSDSELCNIYAGSSDPRAYKEIQQRDLLTDDERKHVLAREVSIGMSEIALICSWGYPSDINRSVGSWGEHEQWVYCPRDTWGQRSRDSCFSATYVYFQNGVVTSWQQ